MSEIALRIRCRSVGGEVFVTACSERPDLVGAAVERLLRAGLMLERIELFPTELVVDVFPPPGEPFTAQLIETITRRVWAAVDGDSAADPEALPNAELVGKERSVEVVSVSAVDAAHAAPGTGVQMRPTKKYPRGGRIEIGSAIEGDIAEALATPKGKRAVIDSLRAMPGAVRTMSAAPPEPWRPGAPTYGKRACAEHGPYADGVCPVCAPWKYVESELPRARAEQVVHRSVARVGFMSEHEGHRIRGALVHTKAADGEQILTVDCAECEGAGFSVPERMFLSLTADEYNELVRAVTVLRVTG